jgi:hypothetical protein
MRDVLCLLHCLRFLCFVDTNIYRSFLFAFCEEYHRSHPHWGSALFLYIYIPFAPLLIRFLEGDVYSFGVQEKRWNGEEEEERLFFISNRDWVARLVLPSQK